MQQIQMVPLLLLRPYGPVLGTHFQPLIQTLQDQNFFLWFLLGTGEFYFLPLKNQEHTAVHGDYRQLLRMPVEHPGIFLIKTGIKYLPVFTVISQKEFDYCPRSTDFKAIRGKTSAFEALFKGVYGLPIATYMKEYRIRKNMELLRQTDSSIAEIAFKVGYETQGKFTKAFKETVKVLPFEYLKYYR